MGTQLLPDFAASRRAAPGILDSRITRPTMSSRLLIPLPSGEYGIHCLGEQKAVSLALASNLLIGRGQSVILTLFPVLPHPPL
jgi:hypothetical protein